MLVLYNTMKVKLSSMEWNLYNAIAYIFNVLITYGIGSAGWFGFLTNQEAAEQYKSLVSPAGYTFAIWGFIFLFQGLFVIVQLGSIIEPLQVILSSYNIEYSKNTLVKNGVEFYYVGVCMLQIVWTLLFSNQLFFLSFVTIVGIAYCLVEIVKQQYTIVTTSEDDKPPSDTEAPVTGETTSTTTTTTTTTKPLSYFTKSEYWLLQFPFALHCGWILAATFVNFNVWLVKLNLQRISIQENVAGFSLFMLLLISILYLWLYNKQIEVAIVIPTVLAWASFGIFVELSNPDGSLLARFDADSIEFHQMFALFVGVAVLGGVIGRTIFSFFAGKKAQEEQNEIECCAAGDYVRHVDTDAPAENKKDDNRGVEEGVLA